MPVQMTERLFVQINSDPFLLGSFNLQGLKFSETIHYLDEFITMEGLHNPAVNELMHQCHFIAETDEVLKNGDAAAIAAHVDKIQARALDLKGDEAILLPGGWSGGTSGHAMVYELKKDAEGNLLFIAYNSGRGLEFHAQREEKTKTKYNPTYTLKIPKDKIGTPNFNQIIKKLMEAQAPQIPKQETVNVEYVYKKCFGLMEGFLGAELVELPTDEYREFTGEQISGTCTQQSLCRLLKRHFSTDEYRRFIYRLKARSLEDYLKVLRDNHQMDDPKYREPVIEVIHHHLRLLNLKRTEEPVTEDLFPLSYKSAETDRLQGLLNYFNTNKPMALPEVTPTLPIDFRDTKQYITRPDQYSDDVSKPDEMKVEDITNIAGGLDLLKDMEALLARCGELALDGNHMALFEQLEQFFNSLPLPEPPHLKFRAPLSPYYAEAITDEETAGEFYRLMMELQEKYFEASNRLIGHSEVLPRMYVTKMSILAVASHVNAHHPIVHQGPAYYQMAAHLSLSLARLPSPYVACNDPAQDMRCHTLRQLFLEECGGSRDVCQKYFQGAPRYYQELINIHPELKTKLEQTYDQELQQHKRKGDEEVIAAEQSHGYQALSYFLRNFNKVLSDKEFSPLLNTMIQQERLEQLLGFHSNRFSHALSAEHDVIAPVLNYNHQSKKFYIKSTMSKAFAPFMVNEALTTGKYNIRGTVAGNALEIPHEKFTENPFEAWSLQDIPFRTGITDSEIQLIPPNVSNLKYPSLKGYAYGESDVENRHLLTLRQSKSTQICKTLEYFFLHPEKLKDPSLQIYLKANLFEGVLLKNALEFPETFFAQLENLIEKGISIYQHDGKYETPAVFLLHLQSQVVQYALKLDKARFAPQFERVVHEIHRQIQLQKDPNVLATLHQERFLLLTARGAQDSTEFEAQVESLFHTQAMCNRELSRDKDQEFQFLFAVQQFGHQLQTQAFPMPDNLIKKIMHDLELSLQEPVDIEQKPPLYIIRHEGKELYTLNLSLGLIFKGERAYGPTPLAILAHPIAKQLGLHPRNYCFSDKRQQNFEIDEEVRFIKWDTGFRIQKKWEGKWYELVDMNHPQKEFWDLQTDSEHSFASFPTILKERQNFAWFALGKATDFLITDEHNTICYRGSTTAPYQLKTEKTPESRALTRYSTAINKLLSSFEDAQFITCWQLNPTEYRVQLPRYGIELNVEIDDATSTFKMYYFLKGVRYELKTDAPKLGEGAAQLCFQQGEDVLCFLPIQRFYATESRSSISKYYRLEQDTAHKIPDKVCEKIKPSCWQYSNKDSYYCLKMDEMGNPIPLNTEHALYLCYVYLCTHQPEKAWDMLEKCHAFGGLEGTYEEIKMLQWIVRALPYQLDREKSEDAIRAYPSVVSCQLKALSLLAQYERRRDKPIQFPLVAKTDANTINGVYEDECRNQIKKFYDGFNADIYRLFQKLQAMRRDLSAHFTLSSQEKLTLISSYYDSADFLHDDPYKIPHGAMGYEWWQLQMSLLKQEYEDLELKKKEREAEGLSTSTYDKNRMETLSSYFSREGHVRRILSHIEYRELNTELKAHLSFQISPIQLSEDLARQLEGSSLFKGVNSTPDSQKEAVDALNVETNDEAFLKRIKDYILVAATKGHPSKDQLLIYCRGIMIAHRHIPMNEQISNLPLMCNILCRISEHSEVEEFNIFRNIESFVSIQEVINRARQLPSPKGVCIPEYQHELNEVICNFEELWAETPTRPPRKPLPGGTFKVSEVWMDEWMPLRQTWQALEKQYQLPSIDVSSADVLDTLGLEKEEYQAGCVKYDAIISMQNWAHAQFTPALLSQLETKTNLKQQELQSAQDTLESLILSLAALGPEDHVKNKSWMVDIASGVRKKPDLTMLLSLYFHADHHRYAEATGLSDDKITELHQLLVKYVAQGIQKSQCERVLTHISSVQKAPDEGTQIRAKYDLAKAFFAVNHIDPAKDPILSVFQFYDEKLLRTEQVETLQYLLSKPDRELYIESVVQIIMGGGKSKIILPTLAQKKADRTNLVIIEVPRALLHTNFKDLQAVSSQFFHQDAYLFDFDRNSDCSPRRLRILFEELSQVILNRGYVVTTGEAIQSLELKYIELETLYRENPSGELMEQVEMAKALVALIKNRGDFIIDEVHQGLYINSMLNYTVSDPEPISPKLVEYSLDLFQFFKSITLSNGQTLEAMMRRDQGELSSSGMMDEMLQTLIQQLLHSEQSPLYKKVKDFSLEEKAALSLYLQNKGPGIPDVVMKADSTARSQFAFYKEQISNVLSLTLKRHQGVNYGPSKLSTLSPLDRLRAIPYLANNVPSEQSRFSKTLVSVNYTIQSLMITGVDLEVMQSAMRRWHIEAMMEVQKKGLENLNQTDVAKWFSEILPELPFSSFNPENQEDMQQLVLRIGQHTGLINQILKQFILPSITVNPQILHSNAPSHVDIGRTMQGMTGTPWNLSTFHRRLQKYKNAGLSGFGSNGLVSVGIARKKPIIRGLDYASCMETVSALFSPKGESTATRAIIDVAARFKGVHNREVANQIAQYIYQNPTQFLTPEPTQYVLFFDNGVLSALKIQADILNQTPIVLGSSDPKHIQSMLQGTSFEACFTYYDQEHTVGTDVKQGANAKALVLIDQDTPLQSYLQGAMRMRQLIEGSQSIEIVVPKALEGQSLSDLMKKMVANQKEQLQRDNYYAATACMKNIIRTDFMWRRIEHQLNPHNFDLLDKIKSYFQEKEEQDLFKCYGAIETLRTTEDLLNELKVRLLEDWENILKELGQDLSKKETIAKELQAIVDLALKPFVCATHQMARQEAQENTVEIEVMRQKEVEMEQLAQKEVEQEMFDLGRKATEFKSWKINEAGVVRKSFWQDFLPLTEICNHNRERKAPPFSENITASVNFYQSYEGQQRYLGIFLKPVHSILFRKDKGTLKAVILSAEETEHFCQNPPKCQDWWITTTLHNTVAGIAPKDIREDKTYQSMMEQIRYFNGELNLILNRDAPLRWLNDKASEKMDYFIESIRPFREVSKEDVVDLKEEVRRYQMAIEMMSANPMADFTSFNWRAHFGYCPDRGLCDFANLAGAFKAAMDTTKPLDYNKIVEKYELGQDAIVALKASMKTLSAVPDYKKRFSSISGSDLAGFRPSATS